MNSLSHERLCYLLDCDPINGLLRWGIKRESNKLDWSRGTLKSKGKHNYYYYSISIDGKSYKVARIIWFYVKREWPDREVDHHNGDSLDNRFDNLRESTSQQNNFNRKLYGRYSRGVTLCSDHLKKKWHAQINIKGIGKVSLGYYLTEQEASWAFEIVAEAMQGSFAYHNRDSLNA